MNGQGPFQCVIQSADRLGECPRWDHRDNRLYWVDITGQRLHRLDWVSGSLDTLSVDEDIGCFALHEHGGFVAGMRSGVWRLDESGQKLKKLAANPEDTQFSRFNDGRADSAGRFWLGTVDENKAGSAKLYCLTPNGLDVIADGLMTSNGLAFSPNEHWMYHSDTPAFVVYRYPFDADEGVTGGAVPWVRLTATEFDRGRPDGAAVDQQGRYWSALYDGGAVACFSREGKLLRKYRLPVRCPTMCAFGGTDLKTLYVTSAREGRPQSELDTHQLSGSLFSMQVDIPGLPEPLCRI